MRNTALRVALSLLSCYAANASTYRVAIVGGGVGGAFTASFLRELIGTSVDIDVYGPSKGCLTFKVRENLSDIHFCRPGLRQTPLGAGQPSSTMRIRFGWA